MALAKVLARDWTLEVEGTTTGTFVPVGGINTFGFGGTKNDTDTGDFDSGGFAEHLVTERAYTLTLSGFFLEDQDTGERDPGQAIVDELATKIGEEAIGNFKLTSPGGTVYTFSGSVEPAEVGGGKNDVTSWGATITVNGKVTVS
jgi:hypothetical protein